MKQHFTLKLLLLALTMVLGTFAKAQEITELYLVGDATPGGWNITNPTPMAQDSINTALFRWNGPLKAGEIKISTFKGDWCDGQWLNASIADQPLSVATYIITEGCAGPDNKWKVQPTEAGVYDVVIDLNANSIKFNLISKGVSDVTLSSLYVSKGELQPAFNPSVTNYNLLLPIETTSVNIVPEATDAKSNVVGGGVITIAGDTLVEIVVSGDDQVSVQTYKINISVARAGEIYSNLYLVGDATPSGWNIAEPTPMVKDSKNPNLFTWSGYLNAGEFKFSTFTGDWCDGDWLLAAEADYAVADVDCEFTVYTGCAPGEEDLKWRVQEGEEDDYLITVDVEKVSISIEKGVYVGIETNELINDAKVFPNPAHDWIEVSCVQPIQQIQIVTMSGKLITEVDCGRNILNYDITNLDLGVYLVKIYCGTKQPEVRKLVINR